MQRKIIATTREANAGAAELSLAVKISDRNQEGMKRAIPRRTRAGTARKEERRSTPHRRGEGTAGAADLSLAVKISDRNQEGMKRAIPRSTRAGTARKVKVTTSWRTACPPSFHRIVASGKR